MTGVGPSAVERRARRLLGAYPWRVRVEQGDEIIGTVLDGLPADATRLPWRDQVDLVRGGLRVRSGRRPPWPTVLAYASGLRIDARWIRWVFDDLEDPHYVRTKRLHVALVWLAVVVPLAVVLDDALVLAYSLGGFLAGWGGVRRERERRRARYGLVAGGSDPNVVWTTVARPAVVPNLHFGAVALAVGLAGSVGAGATLLAGTHPAPDEAPPALADALEVSVHAPSSAGLAPALLAGAALALVGAALVAGRVVACRRRVGAAPVAGRASQWCAGIGGAVVLAASLAPALPLRWLWLSGAWTSVAACALVLALGCAASGGLLLAAGARRGAPIGTWDLWPRVGPREDCAPRPRWLAPPDVA